MLVAGALGVHQADEDAFRLAGPDVSRHAPLLVADLLAASGHSLNTVLAAALADIERTEIADTP